MGFVAPVLRPVVPSNVSRMESRPSSWVVMVALETEEVRIPKKQVEVRPERRKVATAQAMIDASVDASVDGWVDASMGGGVWD